MPISLERGAGLVLAHAHSVDLFAVHRRSVEGGVALMRTRRLTASMRFAMDAALLCEVVGGSLTVSSATRAARLHGAGVAFFRPREVVVLEPRPSNPSHCQLMFLPPRLLETAARRRGLSEFPSLEPVLGADRKLARTLRMVATNLTRGNDDRAGEALHEALDRIIDGPFEQVDEPSAAPWLRRALDQIHDRLETGLSTTELARRVRLSRSHFARSFHTAIGLPPHEYIVVARVSRACELLTRGIDCAAAAQAVGFYDQSHLNRHFRRVLGLTPGEFCKAVSRATSTRAEGTNARL